MPVNERDATPATSEQPPAVKTIPPGFVLCDTCGGILYPQDAPRHSTHTPEEIAAAGIVLAPVRDPEAEAAEQVS